MTAAARRPEQARIPSARGARSRIRRFPKAGVLAALLAGLLLGGCAGERPVLDATPYVSVCFAGENGSGTAELKLDEAGLTRAVYAALGLSGDELPDPDDGNATRAETAAQTLLDSLTLQVTPAEGLSNGDTVTVEGAVEPGLWKTVTGGRLKLSFAPFTAVVSGLSDITPIDPFDNVEPVWSGYAPELSLTLRLRASHAAPWSWISYAVAGGTGLDAGDTVTVTAAADADTLAQLGYRLTAAERQYTVPARLGRYVGDWGELDADGLQTLLDAVQRELALLAEALPAELALPLEGGPHTPQTARCTDAAFDSAYFLTAPDRPAQGPGWRNALVCVYCFNAAAPDAEPAVLYAAFALPDLALEADGTLTVTGPLTHCAGAAADPAALPAPNGAYQAQPVTFARPGTPESAG